MALECKKGACCIATSCPTGGLVSRVCFSVSSWIMCSSVCLCWKLYNSSVLLGLGIGMASVNPPLSPPLPCSTTLCPCECAWVVWTEDSPLEPIAWLHLPSALISVAREGLQLSAVRLLHRSIQLVILVLFHPHHCRYFAVSFCISNSFRSLCFPYVTCVFHL